MSLLKKILINLMLVSCCYLTTSHAKDGARQMSIKIHNEDVSTWKYRLERLECVTTGKHGEYHWDNSIRTVAQYGDSEVTVYRAKYYNSKHHINCTEKGERHAYIAHLTRVQGNIKANFYLETFNRNGPFSLLSTHTFKLLLDDKKYTIQLTPDCDAMDYCKILITSTLTP